MRPNRNADLSSRSAGRFSRLVPSISASFRFTRQNAYCIGQADLLDGRFTRLASKQAGESEHVYEAANISKNITGYQNFLFEAA